MTRLKHTAAAYLSATWIVVASYQLSAFEQGTYFIYQIVEQSDAQTIENRLAVNSQLFIESEETQATVTTETTERSEFEMNYNSFGTTNNSSFEATPSTSSGVPTTNESSSFDIGTKETPSLFGN